jgi:hypothetical protein
LFSFLLMAEFFSLAIFASSLPGIFLKQMGRPFSIYWQVPLIKTFTHSDW